MDKINDCPWGPKSEKSRDLCHGTARRRRTPINCFSAIARVKKLAPTDWAGKNTFLFQENTHLKMLVPASCSAASRQLKTVIWKLRKSRKQGLVYLWIFPFFLPVLAARNFCVPGLALPNVYSENDGKVYGMQPREGLPGTGTMHTMFNLNYQFFKFLAKNHLFNLKIKFCL